MNPEHLIELRDALISLCADVSIFIKDEIKKVGSGDIYLKDLNSLVSYVDKEAEKAFIEGLGKLIPEAGFITEEETVLTETKDKMWIIDPLDGTTNYLQRIPHFSSSIALQYNEEIILGIVYETMMDRAFTAIKGRGAWENELPIKVSGTSENNKAVIVTGFPYKRGIDIDKTMELLKHCIINYRGFRRLGSAALDLVYVASGRLDIYFEKSLNIWDLAAGALIVEESGGKVCDYSGGTDFLKTGEIISSNGLLHKDIFEAINNYLL